MERHGLTTQHLIGMRFAINVTIASTIVWTTLKAIGDSNPIWAIASMVAASDPQVAEAKKFFRARLINVLVGCGVGLLFILIGGAKDWLLPLALATAVLVATYLVRIKTMWRQAPITAAVVIAAGVSQGSADHGVWQGIHKVLEVLFGCFVGLFISWMMSKVWLIKEDAPAAKAA
jgi:uncharacterized membrane protein YccC